MFEHIPVLKDEVIEGLNIKEDGIYLDCTLGGAGHSSEILKRLTSGKLLAFDQDISAIEASRQRLEKISNSFKIYNMNYSQAPRVLKEEGIKVDGILMDIGVSSHQIDTPERGFSYMHDAPLDMRMDRSKDFTARDLLNEYSEDELTEIFLKYGEEKWSKRIAQFIVARRKENPLETTFDLVDVIKTAVPAGARKKGHPAKRVFQAVRIKVNEELKVLEDTIPELVDCLNPKGRFLVISFHSLEDRIVKDIFKYESLNCICPPQLPICQCDKEKTLKLITRKPIVASEEEMESNARAKSAKLRIAERI